MRNRKIDLKFNVMKKRFLLFLLLVPYAFFAFGETDPVPEQPKSVWRRTMDFLIRHEFSFNIGCSFKSGMFMISPSVNIKPVPPAPEPDHKT